MGSRTDQAAFDGEILDVMTYALEGNLAAAASLLFAGWAEAAGLTYACWTHRTRLQLGLADCVMGMRQRLHTCVWAHGGQTNRNQFAIPALMVISDERRFLSVMLQGEMGTQDADMQWKRGAKCRRD